MFEVLIREAAARFGLGDKALALIQMLLACMTGKETGGLTGFLDQFKAAGLGPVVQSWLGGGPAARPISNSQLETVLGASDGLLPLITARLELPRDNVTSALGYLLPTLVGKLTPGGNTPASLPPEIASLAAAGQALLAAAPAGADQGAASGGKWLPWAVVIVLVLIALAYWAGNRGGAPAPAAPASAPAAASAPASNAPLPATTGMAPPFRPSASASLPASAATSAASADGDPPH